MKVQVHHGKLFVIEGCTPLENLIVSVIDSLGCGEEFAHIKQTLLAEMCGIDVSSLIRVMKILEEKNLVQTTKYKLRNQVKGYKVTLPTNE